MGNLGSTRTADEIMADYPDAKVRDAYVSRLIANKLRTLTVLMMIDVVLQMVFFLAFSVVPNYAQIPQGNGFGVPHTIFGIWPYIKVVVFFATFSFGPYFQISGVVSAARAFFTIVIIDIAIHMAHVIMCAVELSAPCETLLCVDASGNSFLIALTIAIVVWIVWDILFLIGSWNYARTLEQVNLTGWSAQIGSQRQANEVLSDFIPAGDMMYQPSRRGYGSRAPVMAPLLKHAPSSSSSSSFLSSIVTKGD